jgi:DNA (cytosine-5)-methyltransferase 1
MSLGFTRVGFKAIHAVDHWKPAVETYRANLGDHVVEQEITDGIELPSSTVIVGGPPCQGFSSAGRRDENDKRNSLVSVFARIVAQQKPKAFVFENVEGFFTGAGGRFVVDLLAPLLEAGYRIHLRKINAANYGVPQHRKRVVGIGGLGWDPPFPEPTHTAHGAPGAHLAAQELPPTCTLLEALEGLPPPTESGSGVVDEHVAKAIEGLDLERARHLKPGQCMRDLPENLWHESYRRRAFRRVMDGTPTECRGGAPFGLRRLRADQPSKAITSGALRDFLHPHEDRPFTLRECARLQTFPDDFRFIGESTADRVLLIGNAVPPLLAEHIARHLLTGIAGAEQCRSSGKLLSFVPTLSTGMSPALEAVVRTVKSRFCDTAETKKQMALWD